jgi:two-component system, chemotaxis family, response regulator Rcp1
MLTSSDLDHEIKMAYELGANAFLTKPVHLDRLVEMVKVLREHWLEFTQAPAVSRSL